MEAMGDRWRDGGMEGGAMRGGGMEVWIPEDLGFRGVDWATKVGKRLEKSVCVWVSVKKSSCVYTTHV